MGQDLPAGPLAVYIHHPFCLQPCPYCSFFKRPWSLSAQENYLLSLHKEAELWEQRFGRRIQASSLYFGGGTPSLLKAEDILRLCACFDLGGTEGVSQQEEKREERVSLKQRDRGTEDFSTMRHEKMREFCSCRVGLSAGRVTRNAYRVTSPEITLEVNPIQITEEFVRELKRTPVNRLSVGVQSVRDAALRYLGRRHKGESIAGRIRLLRDAGYDNISLDLMYGLPGMGLDDLKRDLEAFLALKPEHISCYLLSLEEDSPLGIMTAEGKSPELPDDESCAQQYALIRRVLREAGFQHYEISNFARPGFEGRHNLAYWRSQPYLALGASAAGWLPPWRYTNPCDLEEYSQMVAAGELMKGAEELSEVQAESDEIMMGLRLLEGIELTAFEERHLHEFGRGKERERDKLLKMGMLEIEAGRIRLSSQALFVSNAVIGELI